uniref:ATP-grasp domain-containing protein n=1 Tax=Desulfacinum infernum TaxID=35837 RepID=A0A831ZMK7_9BACT
MAASWFAFRRCGGHPGPKDGQGRARTDGGRLSRPGLRCRGPCGAGSILVEVLQDVNLRLAPVDDALAKVSLLIHHFPLIREVDINPIVLGDHGEQGLAVDARVVLETPNHEDPLL